jgi:hypothetical protein
LRKLLLLRGLLSCLALAAGSDLSTNFVSLSLSLGRRKESEKGGEGSYDWQAIRHASNCLEERRSYLSNDGKTLCRVINCIQKSASISSLYLVEGAPDLPSKESTTAISVIVSTAAEKPCHFDVGLE